MTRTASHTTNPERANRFPWTWKYLFKQRQSDLSLGSETSILRVQWKISVDGEDLFLIIEDESVNCRTITIDSAFSLIF